MIKPFCNRCVFLCLFFCLFFYGCTPKETTQTPEAPKESVSTSPKEQSQSQAARIPMPSDAELEQLGPKNDIDFQWLFSDGYFAIVAQPKRFLESPIGSITKGMLNQLLSAFSPAQGMQIDFESADRMIVAFRKDSLLIPVADGDKVMQQAVPVPGNVLIVHFAEEMSETDRLKQILPQIDDLSAIPKVEGGAVTYYDLTNPQMPFLQSVLFFANNGKTLVFANGVETTIQDVLQPDAPRGALAARLARLDKTQFDLSLLFSFEGTVGELEEMAPILQNVPGFTPAIQKVIVDNSRALTLQWNSAAAENSPTAVATIFSRTDSGAADLQKQFNGLLLLTKTNFAESDNNFLKSLLNSIQLETQDSKLKATLQKFAGMDEAAIGLLQVQLDRIKELQKLQLQFEQEFQVFENITISVGRIGNAVLEYHQANGRFPAPATVSADGTPLLSWRVAILPFLGEDAKNLYKKFKLDESWESENNKLLMEEMPSVFSDERMTEPKGMTTFRLFSSSETPFGKADLKITDVKTPDRTIMLFAVDPENAVQWTKPDSLNYDAETVHSLFKGLIPFVQFDGKSHYGQFGNSPEEIHQLEHAIKGTMHTEGD